MALTRQRQLERTFASHGWRVGASPCRWVMKPLVVGSAIPLHPPEPSLGCDMNASPRRAVRLLNPRNQNLIAVVRARWRGLTSGISNEPWQSRGPLRADAYIYELSH